MMQQSPLLPAALQRLRLSALVPLVGGNLLVFAIAVLALLIPDSHVWQVALSALLALGLLALLLLCNATALRRLRAPGGFAPLWAGALMLGATLLLAAMITHVVALAGPNVELRAGYWNSQLSQGLRVLLPYSRLIALQRFAIGVAQWVVIPAMLLPFLIETASFGWSTAAFRRASRLLLSGRHWLVSACALGISAWLVPSLVAWHPAHTVSGEVFSAVLRLGFAGFVILACVLLLLSIDAELLHRTTSATSRQTPVESVKA